VILSNTFLHVAADSYRPLTATNQEVVEPAST
jgi:hypothetical protein